MEEITEGMTRAEIEFIIYGMTQAEWLASADRPLTPAERRYWRQDS